MKRWGLTLAILLIPFLLGCGSSGGGIFSPDKGSNPVGFTFSTYTSSTNAGISTDFRSTAVSSNGTTVFAGSVDGLYSITQTSSQVNFTKVTDAALTNQVINCLAFEPTGDLLIGTDKGLFRRNATTKAISGVSGLETSQILSLAVQPDGTIWAGLTDLTSETKSIAKSAGGGFTFYGSSLGMTASQVVNIYADADLVVACGQGSNGGLFQFTGSKFKFIDDLTLASGASLFFRIGDNWYAGGPGSGLYYSSITAGTRKWTAYDALKNKTPTSFLLEAMDGGYRYWVLTTEGLAVSTNLTSWGLFNKSNRLTYENGQSIAGNFGTIWIANPGPTGGITRGVYTGD